MNPLYDSLIALFRALLMIGGGSLVSRGYLTGDQLALVVGLLLSVGAAAVSQMKVIKFGNTIKDLKGDL